jgi:POT family proton-dependent oligopeptide transporter
MSDENPTLPAAAAGVPVTEARDSSMPRGVPYIVGNEAAERFSYYGMRSILAAYITGAVLNSAQGGLGQAPDKATFVIHLFVAANYFMPLLGAWLSDKIIGRYHTILWVSLFYCAGHGVLACSELLHSVPGKLNCLFAGLALIAFGSGGIKPCVSAFMGDQFKPNQAHLLQKAYGAFYWSINFGSFFSFLVIPWVKDSWGYGWAFGVPGILMALATFIFWLGTKHYQHVPPSRKTKQAGFLPVFGYAFNNSGGNSTLPAINFLASLGLPFLGMLLMTFVSFWPGVGPAVKGAGWCAMGCVVVWYLLVIVLSFLRQTELPESFWRKASGRYSDREITAARSVGPILFVFAFVPIFWSLFDQTNSTWVLQGEQMVPANLFGLKIGAEQMQSANPAIVMILVPLLTLLVYPRIGKWAAPLRRMSYGMFLAAAAYVVVAALQARIDGGAKLSVLWQTVPYLVLTSAEVLISTTGLEFAFREAAPEMKSLIMSFWLLTVTFGNLFVASITKMFSGEDKHAESVTPTRFLIYAGLTLAVAIIFSAVSTVYRYRDKEAAEGR